MNRSEADQIMALISERQKLDAFDEVAIREVIASHTRDDVTEACIEIKKKSDFISAARLAEHLEPADMGAADSWDWVVENIINGPLAELWRARERIEDEHYPNEATMRTFRKVHQSIRNDPADKARRRYLDTYDRCVKWIADRDRDAELSAIAPRADAQSIDLR